MHSESTSPVVPKDRYDLRILSALRRIIRTVDIYSHKLANDHGVTVPQLICLTKVAESGPLTLRELSQQVYLSPSTLVGIVDRLERSGLFIRNRSSLDRRKVEISLTQAGKDMVAKSPAPLQDNLAQSIEKLNELEKSTIALSLDKLISLLDETPPGSVEMKNITLEPVLETQVTLD